MAGMTQAQRNELRNILKMLRWYYTRLANMTISATFEVTTEKLRPGWTSAVLLDIYMQLWTFRLAT